MLSPDVDEEAALANLSAIERSLKRYRKAIRASEDDAVDATRRAFEATRKAVEKARIALIARMEKVAEDGESVTATWLLQEERYTALLQQIAASGEMAAGKAATGTGTAQASAVATAASNAEKWTYLSVGVKTAKAFESAYGVSWNALSSDALRAYVGLAGDGSPLRDLFASVSKDEADKVRDTLFAGIGAGTSAREIAGQLTALGEESKSRAYTIARTEVNRAARTASIDSYAQNPRLVEGWIWVSSCDLRTCPACFAMHGSEHPASESFGSHPSCRCCAIPQLVDLRTSADQPDVRPTVEPGADKFAGLSEADQRKILGPTKYTEYAAGRIRLADTVHVTADPRWGITRREASAAQALQSAASR